MTALASRVIVTLILAGKSEVASQIYRIVIRIMIFTKDAIPLRLKFERLKFSDSVKHQLSAEMDGMVIRIFLFYCGDCLLLSIDPHDSRDRFDYIENCRLN
jgi:hypothetical protein